MRIFRGYCRAFEQYMSSEKGRHDIWDYFKAFLSFLAVCVVLYVLAANI